MKATFKGRLLMPQSVALSRLLNETGGKGISITLEVLNADRALIITVPNGQKEPITISLFLNSDEDLPEDFKGYWHKTFTEGDRYALQFVLSKSYSDKTPQVKLSRAEYAKLRGANRANSKKEIEHALSVLLRLALNGANILNHEAPDPLTTKEANNSDTAYSVHLGHAFFEENIKNAPYIAYLEEYFKLNLKEHPHARAILAYCTDLYQYLAIKNRLEQDHMIELSLKKLISLTGINVENAIKCRQTQARILGPIERDLNYLASKGLIEWTRLNNPKDLLNTRYSIRLINYYLKIVCKGVR